MSTDASKHQQISPFSSLSMNIPPIEMPGVNKVSPRSKHTSLREPWPKEISLGAQPLLSANARMAPLDQSPKVQSHKSGISGLQKSSSLNKRGRKPVETTPLTPKAPPLESFEIVRVKMRESLAAALELVVDEQNKPKIASRGDANMSEATDSTDKVLDGALSGDVSSEIVPSDHKSECSIETSRESSHQMYAIAHDKSANSLANEGTTNVSCDNLQEFRQKGPLTDDGPLSESILMKDDFLQENGLCWASSVGNVEIEEQEHHDSKRPKLSCNVIKGSNNKKPQILALEIEEELFKLFGGVNKKYKERGRSLMFNLKDRLNPELRQRVFSGEISPERLCTMTVDELASKELSQWRIAKAEELAQMVVLPDSDNNLRMVKKTHKGEFQVEVEHEDTVSVEVTFGTNLLPRYPVKSNGNENKHPKACHKDYEMTPEVSKSSEELTLHSRRDSDEQLPLYDLDSPQQENTDLMQYLMVEEPKDAQVLPPVPSLDEFMMELASEPPFVNLQESPLQESTMSDEKSSDSLARQSQDATENLEMESNALSDKSEIKSGKGTSRGIIGSKMGAPTNVFKSNLHSGSKNFEVSPDSNSAAFMSKLHHTAPTNSRVSLHSAKKSNQIVTKLAVSDSNLKQSLPPKDVSNGELVWDGLIQLNISSLVTALGFHKSGEQVSTKEWPSFLEIKGRVRLDAFEKFLQELRLSRSRAIMVLQFCWKEGSPESGRMKLCETVDSYVVDERVGFAEPVPGLELYFCPPHPKTTQMLISNLPKENEDTLHKVDDGLIGILVWKKEASPKPVSHPRKHSGRHSLPRNLEDTRNPHAAPPAADEEEEIDDVPPGFGPPAAAPREDDDLPEFSFVQDSTKQHASPHFASPKIPPSHPHIAVPPSLAPNRPVEQIRELIQKYGSNVNKNSCDDDDDDIPEWRPDLQVNPSQHPMAYQLQQPNHYQQQIANQFPMPPHRPIYSKTDNQVPQNHYFAPGQWSGHYHSGGRPDEPKYQGLPGPRRHTQNPSGWNPAFPRGR